MYTWRRFVPLLFPPVALISVSSFAGCGRTSLAEPSPVVVEWEWDGGERFPTAEADSGTPRSDDAGSSSLGPIDATAPPKDAGADATFTFTDGGSAATAYQINPAHAGFVDDPTLTPPLTRLWDIDLGAESGYPLIADGRVFLTSENGDVRALDARTGSTDWGPVSVAGAQSDAPMATYDLGRLFVLTWSGSLTAFDGRTGATVWSSAVPGSFVSYDSPPTAYGGILYVAADANLYALDETSGATLWNANIGGGDYSSPAVSSSGVYVAYAGPQVYAIDPLTGAQLWHFAGPAGGGGGETPVLFGGALYAMDPDQPIVLSATTGQSMGTFASFRTPAFHDNTGFFPISTRALAAEDLTSHTLTWTFPGADGGAYAYAEPISSPVVANGYVYAGFIYFGPATGAVAALDETTGALVWWDDVSADLGHGEDFGSYYSLAAAGGVLVVPAMNHVVGYASAPAAGDP